MAKTTVVTIYFAYFLQFMKARLAYKADFVASLFAGILISTGGLLFVLALVDGRVVPELRGWRRFEVLFIYGFSMVSTGLFSMLSRNLYSFSDRYIIQGEFDRVLLRPLDTLAQVVFDAFHIEGIGTVLLGAGLMAYVVSNGHIFLDSFDVAWLIISAVSGATVLLAVFVVLVSFSFFFEDRIGIAPPVYNLMQFGRYPLTIYNKVLQAVLSFIIPFGFIAFYPLTDLLGRSSYRVFCYSTPAVALGCVIIARSLWNLGISRYTSTGN